MLIPCIPLNICLLLHFVLIFTGLSLSFSLLSLYLSYQQFCLCCKSVFLYIAAIVSCSYGHMSIVFLFLTLYSPIPSDIINLVCIHNIVLPSSLHFFPSIYLCLIVCRIYSCSLDLYKSNALFVERTNLIKCMTGFILK